MMDSMSWPEMAVRAEAETASGPSITLLVFSSSAQLGPWNASARRRREKSRAGLNFFSAMASARHCRVACLPCCSITDFSLNSNMWESPCVLACERHDGWQQAEPASGQAGSGLDHGADGLGDGVDLRHRL